MRIRQYCYFALRSESLTAEEMTRVVGLTPDETRKRGDPSPRHRFHSWRITARQPEPVDDQIHHLITRLTPVAGHIETLVAASPVSATLQVVRYFNHPSGAEDNAAEQDGLRRLPGQHQLLGWHLDQRTLAFLRLVRADLDIDEYDAEDH